MDTYTVQAGDTLSKIAEYFYGNAGLWKIIFDVNKGTLKDPNKIFPGQELLIPPADHQPSADAGRTNGGGRSSSGSLRSGSRGQAVTNLQHNLNALGYGLVADGIFGQATATAVCHLQGEHGLTADGIVGPQTLALISELLDGASDTVSDEEEESEEESEEEESEEEESEEEESEEEESEEESEEEESEEESEEEEEDELASARGRPPWRACCSRRACLVSAADTKSRTRPGPKLGKRRCCAL